MDARERLLESLAREIGDARVLAAMARVPRERFVPPALAAQAYVDAALPIAGGQSISQPLIVALMTQALELGGTERVLEIGTGSGYQAAILAELAAEVVSLERQPALAESARAVLDELNYRNVTVVSGDGSLGWPERAPYDGIIVTAAAPHVPHALVEQLAEGGRLVVPVGGADEQQLVQYRKTAGGLKRRELGPCRFVPLIGKDAWPEEGGPRRA